MYKIYINVKVNVDKVKKGGDRNVE